MCLANSYLVFEVKALDLPSHGACLFLVIITPTWEGGRS